MTGGPLGTLVARHRVLVCCGSGGVGKTTTAAALALEGAVSGKRAVVVTIDPARRLADALGLRGGLTNEPRRIEGPWPGELWAMMLDTKRTFDELVRKHASGPEQVERILANRFYRNISEALSGTQEYMAMEKLYELHAETDFDLIVVDTPPTRNALDFIEAPRRLTRFLEHRLYRIVTAPNRGVLRAVNLAAQTFIRTVARVVGAEVIDDAVAFFQAFDGMEQGFRERADHVTALMADESTAFVLVTSPRRDAVAEARFFAERLAEAGIDVRMLVVNRLHPRFGDGLPEATRERARTWAGTALGDHYTNLADFQLIADRERRQLAEVVEAVAPAPALGVPFLPFDVCDLGGLEAVRTHLHDAEALTRGS